MIKLVFFLLLPTLVFSGEYSKLDKLKKEMNRDLYQAISCLPKLTKNGGAKFCSGFTLSKRELENLQTMSFKSCKKQIKRKFGFLLSQEVQPRQLPEEEYSRFMHSTKRAQVYYPEKLVLLKQNTDRIDCIHELMHLYQYFSNNKSSLSIKKRNDKEKVMVLELESHIKRVSLLEKRKKIREAQKIGQELQPFIKFLGRYKDQHRWLHEKEIYYFLYKNCEKFKCTVLDKDIALANLYALRNYFPWRIKDWLISESAKLIKQKEREVFNKVMKDWKPLRTVKKTLITEMIGTSLSELKEKLRKDKVYFIKNSLFREGTICDNGELIILHKGELDHALVVAGALRKQQLANNKKLCERWPDTRKTSKEFNQGIVSREDYERIVLTSKMAKVLSDMDVYSILFDHQELFPTDETSLILDRWLNAKTASTFKVWDVKLPRVFNKGMRLRFQDINDLPMIYINSRKLVLDLGAMDSVIRPIALSTEQLKSMVVLESKTLNTAEGRTQSAPKVMLTTPMTNYTTKMQSTRWVLADLKIIGVDGTFGLNNFNESEFSIAPRTKMLTFSEFKKMPKGAFPLQKNHRGEFDAIEFKCPEGYILRVDTGSQIRGDIKKENLGKNFKKGSLKCGKHRFKGPFEEIISDGPIFSRDVILNMGWPLLREFKEINISLKNGWVNFKR